MSKAIGSMTSAGGSFAVWIVLVAACGNSNQHGVDAMGDGARIDAASDGAIDAAIDAQTKQLLQQAYVKASNTRAFAGFGGASSSGTAVAMSADGSTLAVGSSGESSAAIGIDGNQADTSAGGAGAVYVFTRTGTTWSQQAYVKASNTRPGGAGAGFGVTVALSADGNTLAVGALGETSAAIGIDGNQADTSASAAGAVYIYTRAGTTWNQQAYVKASNTRTDAQFGIAVALSSDGSTLAVGSFTESSAATGIGGNQADTSAFGAGAVYVYTRAGTTWSQQAYVKASNTRADADFGSAVALSADGSMLAVGSALESSAATGINGNQADTSATRAGAVYVFTHTGTTWSQQAYVKASNTSARALFGFVALSTDGNTLAVGSPYESSAATGIDGNQADASATNAGAVYMFTRTGTMWSQQAYVKASNTRANALFASAVTLSADGNTLAVGSYSESSAATGIDGNQSDTSADSAGAVYVFAAQ